MKTSKILDRITKLVRKQQSAQEIGSIQEAETFATKIQELLLKYNIEMSQIDTGEEKEIDRITKEYDKAWDDFAHGQARHDLFRVIAKYNFCHVYRIGLLRENKIMLIGTPENIQVVRYIFNVVNNIFQEEAKKNWKKYKDNALYILEGREKPVGKRKFYREFLFGCKRGLDHKLKEEQEKFIQVNENAFAVIKGNDVVLHDYLRDVLGQTSKAQMKTTKMGLASEQGYQVGKNVQITKGVGEAKPVSRKVLNK